MKKRFLLLFMATSLLLTGCGATSKETAAYDMAAGAPMAEAPMAEATMMEEAVEYKGEMGIADAAMGAAQNVDMETAAAQVEEKLIITYNYSVETTKFDEFMDLVANRTAQFGGYMEASEVHGNVELGAMRYGYLTIRIPSAKMNDFLGEVESNANVTYRRSSSENITLNYIDTKTHVEALEIEKESLLKMLEQAESIEDIMAIQSQLTAVRYELESYASQLRAMDNKVDYSTLYLDINEVERESATDVELGYFAEIKQGLSDNFYDLGQSLRDASIGIITNLPYIIVWAVILIVCIWIGIKAVGIGKNVNEKKEARRAKKKEERVKKEDNTNS